MCLRACVWGCRKSVCVCVCVFMHVYVCVCVAHCRIVIILIIMEVIIAGAEVLGFFMAEL